MNHLIKVGVGLLVAAWISACGGGSDRGEAPRTAELKAENIKLLAGIDQLKARVKELDDQISGLRFAVTMLQVTGPQETALFDPQEAAAYSAIKAPAGPVLVILEKVEPYLDGFVISMRLGNPTSASYAGFKGKVKWGRKYDASKSAEHNALQEKDLDMNDVLSAGTWTVVKFNVAPATPEQVRRILFSPQFNQISLRRTSAP